MYVFGGKDDASFKNDVYKSSDGITWDLVTSSASFSKRSNFATIKFDKGESMYVIGG